MKDIPLADLARRMDEDGSIDRNDLMQLLRATGGDDGVVDATEFSDLQTIMNNAWTLNMPDYVRVLGNDVVNGNTANAHYQGQLCGTGRLVAATTS